MEIPDWLTKKSEVRTQNSKLRKTKERFLDKTLKHVISFTEDTMFNEVTSSKNGFLQSIEPRIKFLSVSAFIVVLSLQKSIYGIFAFIAVSSLLVILSKIPLRFFLMRLMPVFLFTLLIVMPASLNIIVKGEPLIKLYSLTGSYRIGSLKIPQDIYITRQGTLSALTLLLRVTASVSFVFLITLTTKPDRFIKTVSSFMPGAFKQIVSISYRYIFLLVRKVEQFIMGFKSRNISPALVKTGHLGGNTAQRWVASRIGLLFSISLNLSSELEKAMESRGYRGEEFKLQIPEFKLAKADIFYLIFSIVFIGVMIWKSLT